MDLTKAIIELTKASEGRRTARKALRESVDELCELIVEQGRSGDKVAVNGREYKIAKLYYLVSQWGNGANARIHRSALLMVGNQVMHDGRETYHDGNNTHYPGNCDPCFSYRDDDEMDIYLASDQQRVEFAKDAALVMVEFAKLYNQQRAVFTAAAQTIQEAKSL